MKIFIFLTLFLSSFLLSKELQIKANQFQTDEKTGITVFEGNVNIITGEDELNASKITIFTNKKREPIKFIADGGVSFFITTKELDRYKGIANKVIYIPEKKEYYFYKNVRLEQLNDTKVIIGEEVVLKTTDGEAYAKGADKDPVIMIFDMPEKEDK